MTDMRRRGYAAVLKIVEAVAAARDRERLFPIITQVVQSVIPSDYVGFTIGRYETQQFGYVHTDPPILLPSFDLRDYYRPETVFSGRAPERLFESNLVGYPVHQKLWRDHGIRETYGIPMLVEDRRVGALLCWSKQAGRFDDVDDAVALELARVVAVAVDNCLAAEQAEALRDAMADDNSALRHQLSALAPSELVHGSSPAFAAVQEQIALVAPTHATVLLTGESGTGKDMVARAIHAGSSRRDRPMVTVNCAALPGRLAESELFGHEEGAFTGATRSRAGRFELASGTTIFLDEIGELSLDVQAKLLRVLQEREVQRVGGADAVPVDVRIIAATNRDLRAMIADGTFREDLFYRINVFPILLPPLRTRRGDLPALVEAFVERAATRLRVPHRRVTPEAMRRLTEYDWPGNVRELQNAIERAMIVSAGPELDIDAVVPRTLATAPATVAPDALRTEYTAALEACDWVIEGAGGAAARIGLHPNTLRHRLKKLGIERPIRKPSSP